MSVYDNLYEFARVVEDDLLERVANGVIQDYKIDINHDDREIEGTFVLAKPIKFICVNILTKRLE